MKYYKVLSNGSSVFARVVNNKNFVTNYSLGGVWTYPSIPCTKLFVFDNFTDAQNFTNKCSRPNLSIMECEVQNPVSVSDVAKNAGEFQDYWTGKPYEAQTPEPGTVMVDAVKIL